MKIGNFAITRDRLILFFGSFVILYTIYILAWLPPPPYINRGLFLAVFVILAVLLKPPKSTVGWIVVGTGAVLAVGGCLYAIVFNYRLEFEQINAASEAETYLLPFFIAGLMIVSHRVGGGAVINILTLIILLYLWYGQYIPGMMGHTPLSPIFITSLLYNDIATGIFGPFTDIFVRIISIFMVFAAFLFTAGLGDVFTAIATKVASNSTGGPAKASVLSSGLFGMISGSAVANVATTGAFTIPAMKSAGYEPKMAASVEALSSTGGMIMPPIMGAVAFLMSDILGIPYFRVVLAAIVPAFLWYFTTYLVVHFYGLKHNIRKWRPPFDTTGIIRERVHLLLALVALIWGLYYFAAAEQGALIATGFLFLLSFIRKSTRPTWAKLADFVRNYVNMLGPLIVLIAVLSILIAGLTGTGLHYKIGEVLLGGIQNWFFVLLITFGLTFVLGMGVTPIGTYLAAVVIAVPILAEMGFNPLAAHFFIFWASSLGPITPPVCLATFTAARLAGANMMKTGITATLISLPIWIVPFILAKKELLITIAPISVIGVELSIVCAGILIFVIGTQGYFVRKLNMVERVIATIAGVMVVQPVSDYLTYIFLGVGIALVVYLLLHQLFYVVRAKKV